MSANASEGERKEGKRSSDVAIEPNSLKPLIPYSNLYYLCYARDRFERKYYLSP